MQQTNERKKQKKGANKERKKRKKQKKTRKTKKGRGIKEKNSQENREINQSQKRKE